LRLNLITQLAPQTVTIQTLQLQSASINNEVLYAVWTVSACLKEQIKNFFTQVTLYIWLMFYVFEEWERLS